MKRLSEGWSRVRQVGRIAAGTIFVTVLGIGYVKQRRFMTVSNDAFVVWDQQRLSIDEKRQEFSLVAGNPRPSMTFASLLQTIDWIKDDDRVSGLLLRIGTTGLGFAQLQELSDALKSLKAARDQRSSPLRLIASAESFDNQMDYYLASVCDEVLIEPLGTLSLGGISTYRLFLRGLLDMIGIDPRASTVGEYKSVMGMFADKEFQQKHLENAKSLLDSLNSQFFGDIAANRKKSLDRIHHQSASNAHQMRVLADKSPLSAVEAETSGLVDGLGYVRLWKTPKTDSDSYLLKKSQSVSLLRYNKIRTAEKMRENAILIAKGSPVVNVAIVTLSGAIMRNNTITDTLIEIGTDSDVNAIVLRIDSGGGDPLKSDSMWEAVQHIQTKLKKPVVASFGNMCASGGYYAASAASTIFASRATVTGSIGVASMWPFIPQETLDKVGLNLGRIFGSLGAQNASILEQLSPEASERRVAAMQNIYNTFLDRVNKGRQIPMHVLEPLAGGRIYSGEQALAVGLVDRIGGLSNAVDEAVKLAIVSKPGVKHVVNVSMYPKQKSIIKRLWEAQSSEELSAIVHGGVINASQCFIASLFSQSAATTAEWVANEWTTTQTFK